MSSVITLLKASPKGQLVYKSDPNIDQEYLEEYLSPPKLSRPHEEVSAENSFSFHEEEEDGHMFDTSDSDISGSIRNLHIEVKNNTRKTQKLKVHFDNENSNCVKDMKAQIFNKQVSTKLVEGGLSNGIKIKIENNLYKPNHRKNSAGMLREKPNDLSSFEKSLHPKMIVSPEYNRSRLNIQGYEEELKQKTKEEFERKRDQFKKAGRIINAKAEQRIDEFENRRLEKAKYHQHLLEQEDLEGSAKLSETLAKKRENHLLHAKMVEQKKERMQEEMKRMEAEKRKIWERTKTIVNETKTLLDKIQTLYDSFSSKLPENIAKAIHGAQQRCSISQQIMSSPGNVPDITDQQLVTIAENFRFLSNTQDFIQQSIQEVKEREKKEAEAKAAEEAAEEARKKAEALARRATSIAPVESLGQPLISSTPIPGAAGTQGASAGAERAATEVPDGEVLCVDVVAFQEYTRLQQKLRETEASIQVLSSTPQLKKLKFDLQKAVNIPVNAISAVSGAHLRDKLQRLLVLLSGQQIEISNKRVSVSEHPAALTFCKYLIAKMVVKKGEEQVSSIFESAFPLAAVTVGMLVDHSDMKDLLLGHFHSLCPYTVPYHKPRQDQQSIEDFHKALGYKYDSDGNVEKQDKFLKRMSGIMRLYASLMVSSPPQRQSAHPFGIENAWLWLSRVMNIQPLPDVTATMVFDLLEVTGHALYREYRKQFLKMLHILIREFLPKLKSVASSGGGGPVSRLEALIKASIQRQGQIPPPEGLLPQNFWFS